MTRRRSLLSILFLFAAVGCSAPTQPVAQLPASPSAAVQPSPTSQQTQPSPTSQQTQPSPTAQQTQPTTSAPAAPSTASGPGVALVGALKLNPTESQAHADIAAYKQLAFIGKRLGICPQVGVDIIDISDPAKPTKIGNTQFYADTATEDMQAVRIGDRDVLVVGLQSCGGGPGQGGTNGIDLVDITDPAAPKRLALYEAPLGVHELNLTQTPDGRTLALLAIPFVEARTAGESGAEGIGDLMIVDITDPTKPTLTAEWGVLDEPQLGREVFRNAQSGTYAGVFLHSVRANADGTRLYLSYWDAGMIMLDIRDPSKPTYLGRTTYNAAEEGNAHSVDESDDSSLLVLADEDLSPEKLSLTSNVYEGERGVLEARFAQPVGELENGRLQGEVVDVGQACAANAGGVGTVEDVFTSNVSGKIALIEFSNCRFDELVARAQNAGATAVIMHGTLGSANDAALLQGTNIVSLPDGTRTNVSIPALFVPTSVGLALQAGQQPVTVEAQRKFTSWSFLRFFDIQDPANPKQLSTFATEHTNDPETAIEGLYSVHNPEVVGDLVYASWYNDGVRVIDISDRAAPREVGAWVGEGAPEDATKPLIWSVVPHNDVLLASDMNYGLYVLKYTP